jgi:hypothetical protein
MPTKTTARQWQKRLYLDAFRVANPDRDIPIVDYESGWWVFRSRRGERPERRVRTKEFAEMTFRLEERVKEVTHAE